MTKVYVSYGSNMDVTQMMERCPDARLKGRGVLRDYELFIAQYNYQKLQSEMENIASPKWRKLQRIF